MKFLRLIVRNAFRNRRRTVLTALSIAVSLFVFASTRNVLTAMDAWDGQAATHHRVVVQSAAGLGQVLPLTMEKEIRERYADLVEKDKNGQPIVQKMNWFGGFVSDKYEDWFANFAVDAPVLRDMWDELAVTDEDFRKFCADDKAVLIGEALLKRMQQRGYGWKIGHVFNMPSMIYPCTMENLVIVGTFKAKTQMEEEQLFFHWSYFNRQNGERGEVGTYWLKAKGPDAMAQLKSRIDADYANSPDRTETLSEKEFAAQFRSMMGNVTGFVTILGSVIVLALLFVAANTIAMTARERVTEVAVLRTLGFSKGQILYLFLAESVFVSLLGAAVAAGLAYLLYNVAGFSPQPMFFPQFTVAPKTLGLVMIVGFAVGLLAAIVPAVRSAMRPIVQGLRMVA